MDKLTPCEPLPNDRYKDSHGLLVTVQAVAFNRVTFRRDGYPAPCTMPQARFVAEFTITERA
ncbi:DUF4222 domain-containing protein [Yersinia pseudotuberculosis]|uniref:DUF4222 domain-containing protein n=1 Tax=Yersinia pseudotuberculosis serotype O:3 (strain YPIII) TaxID=502800 RepID=A0A0H3B868_YERPY|nr:DUF4222 domain-containing protein [Yersinia pseudotuberculosis]AJJ58348.1 hypothetical protein BZ22_13 [Yersinia pseudotuberculosis YPIII]AYW89502.1 DUF4222 domain-containing protein [Yersinia pseudotuberculosis]AYX00251.1 DUF4222 domain-containing protein [Yersinia pseudotuberculosis]AZA31816.1 DUF4222 domain-containing protein [Yersinia pseudotuberculosis]MBK1423315.1 DUF4222 domain-containing protein [Yersinia pseudotuberculosis]